MVVNEESGATVDILETGSPDDSDINNITIDYPHPMDDELHVEVCYFVMFTCFLRDIGATIV